MLGEKIQHHIEQTVGNGPGADPDADMAAHGVSQPLASFLQTLPALGDRSRIFTKGSARCRQGNALGLSVKQLAPKFAFQPFYLCGKRRLRNKEIFRGFGNAVLPGDLQHIKHL